MGGSDLVHIIDDDDALRDSLSFLLSSVGIKTKSYETATGYSNDPERGACGCILTDVRMPGMSGIDLAQLIKQRKRSRHVPILFLTAHSVNDEDVLRGYGVGAVDYLSKPVNTDQLLSLLRVWLYR